MLTNVAMQVLPSQTKTVFIDDYLLRNSQWTTKSEMRNAAPVDKIKSFTERDTSPKIDTFIQYISLVDIRDDEKLQNFSVDERNNINSAVHSSLFLIAVFCCLSIRMRKDWAHWEEFAKSVGYRYEDMIFDFKDLAEE